MKPTFHLIPLVRFTLIALTTIGWSTINSSDAEASTITSAYSKIDWEKSCKRIDTPPVDEPDMGGIFQCQGYQDYPIWVSTGDLRESVQFGQLNPQMAESGSWESFSGFNQINTTIEWRLKDGKPFAAIYRHFIDSPDGDNTKRAQFLIIKSVARAETDGIGCIYGMISGKEFKANETARLIADSMQNPVSKCVSAAPVDFYISTPTAPFYRVILQDDSMTRRFPDPLK